MPIHAVHGNKWEGAAEVPCLRQKRPQPLHRAALLWSNPDEVWSRMSRAGVFRRLPFRRVTLH
jgi:hypothetical protein